MKIFRPCTLRLRCLFFLAAAFVLTLTGCQPQIFAKCYTSGKLMPLDIPASFAGNGLDGKTIALRDYRGKVVLLDFWSTGCVPCVAQLPHIAEVYQKYHPQGFEVIGITIDRKPEVLKRFLEKRQITWPQITDPENKLGSASIPDGHGSPMTVLFDRQGTMIAADLEGEQLETRVAEELKK